MEPKQPTITEHVKVYIRQRPSTDHNFETSSAVRSFTSSGECVYQSAPQKKKHEFKFEGFLGDGIEQSEVYDRVGRPIVDSALKGYSGTIFAYGPTNSGKTHTIRGGNNADIGIMPRCIEQLLSSVSGGRGLLFVSYLQIYCEVISDLLISHQDDESRNDVSVSPTPIGLLSPGGVGYNPNQLVIREKNGNVFVEGLSKTRITSLLDLEEVLLKGDRNRSTATTNANQTSSRSHAALIVTVTMKETVDAEIGQKLDPQSPANISYCESTLVIVDLAGSERASASEGKHYIRYEEAKAINLSLSALGNCMNALAEGRKHIPYRDSKLTRLLQASLGGRARTSVIVTIPQGEDGTGEILNALKFAGRATQVKVEAKIIRFLDFEGLYNKAQDALNSLDRTEKDKDSHLQWVNEKVEHQASELESLRDEVRTLRAQIECLGREGNRDGIKDGNKGRDRERVREKDRNGEYVELNSSDISVTCEGAAFSGIGRGTNMCDSSDVFLGIKSDGNKTALVLNQYRNHVEELSEKHLTDLSRLRAQLEDKITFFKKAHTRSEEEVSELQNDLLSERKRHLASVQDIKAYHEKSLSIESKMGERVAELLAELSEKNSKLEDLQESSLLETHRANKAEAALAAALACPVDTVSKGQFVEMEALFIENVNRLSNRVIELENLKKGMGMGIGMGGYSRGDGTGTTASSSSYGSGSDDPDDRLPPKGGFGGQVFNNRIEPGGRVRTKTSQTLSPVNTYNIPLGTLSNSRRNSFTDLSAMKNSKSSPALVVRR